MTNFFLFLLVIEVVYSRKINILLRVIEIRNIFKIKRIYEF